MSKTSKNSMANMTSFGGFTVNSKLNTGDTKAAAEENNFKDVDQFKDTEQLKAYVLSLMSEMKS